MPTVVLIRPLRRSYAMCATCGCGNPDDDHGQEPAKPEDADKAE